MTDHQHDIPHAIGEIFQREGTGTVEIGPQQQVFGRIATQRQFGRDDDVGTGLARSCDRLGYAAGIAVEVTHGAVDLRDGDFQRVFHTVSTIPARRAGFREARAGAEWRILPTDAVGTAVYSQWMGERSPRPARDART